MNIVGEIKMFGGSFEPKGWMFCDGRSLSTSSYPLLYSIVGLMYGGDGVNFNLPNLTHPDGIRYIICLEGIYPEC